MNIIHALHNANRRRILTAVYILKNCRVGDPCVSMTQPDINVSMWLLNIIKIKKMIIASMCGLDAAHSLQMRYIYSQGKLNTFVKMCRTHHSTLVMSYILTY